MAHLACEWHVERHVKVEFVLAGKRRNVMREMLMMKVQMRGS